MRRYALNSAVITTPGDYTCRLVTPNIARDWWCTSPVDPRIGYEETCAALARVLSIEPPPVDRRTIQMNPGDEALLFRIALPPNRRRVAVTAKGQQGLLYLIRHCEIGLLRRTA